jgi:hypothetical protein
MSAMIGITNKQTALLATNPPTHPLAHKEASGLPKRTRVTITAASKAAELESIVFTAMIAIWPGTAPLNRIALAQLRPIHPGSIRAQPKSTYTML